jgi:hypothetical protein
MVHLSGSLAVWQFGSLAVWQFGSLAVWQFGSFLPFDRLNKT